MAEEKEISIVIRGRNLTSEEFDAARRSLVGIRKETEDSNEKAGMWAKLWSKAGAEVKTSLAGIASGFALGNLITNGVSALTRFTSAAIESAGATLDLANKTGLTTDTIQRMAHAAALTGTSVDTFTNAALQLGVRIAGGEKSVRNAVMDLGLSFADLQAMGPDELFAAIATELEGMEDPNERNRLALELFGKAGKDILPAIAEGWRKISENANIAGREQLEAVDKAADAWDAFLNGLKTKTVSFLGNAVRAVDEVASLSGKELSKFIGIMGIAGPAAATEYLGAVSKVETKHKDVHLAIEKTTRASVAHAEETKRAATAQRELASSATELTKRVDDETVAAHKNDLALARTTNSLMDLIKAQRVQADVLPQLVSQQMSWTERIDENQKALERSAHWVGVEMRTAQEDAKYAIDQASIAIDEQELQLGELAQAMTDLSQTTGSGLIGTLASLVNAFDVASRARDSFREGLDSLTSGGGLRSILSGFAGIIGGISGIISAAQAAWGVVKGLMGLFSGGEEAKVVNPARDKFLAQFGPGGLGEDSGFHNLARLLHEATGSGSLFESLRTADTRSEFDAAVEAINRALGRDGFAGGTPNQDFMNFGRRRTVSVHGEEAIINRAGVGQFAAQVASALNSMGGAGGDVVISGPFMIGGDVVGWIDQRIDRRGRRNVQTGRWQPSVAAARAY